ncbi:hypothetical protein CDV31_014647 [Fusarium ambrosium]|uniref:Uncharacterized protein n=1 Tax=Fusarium ambrosium TaxID=131363 RepID=A0A428SUU5_9HYPO|nr:hypothetical protein CDV31_014647 [Fusarium ambrosium]
MRPATVGQGNQKQAATLANFNFRTIFFEVNQTLTTYLKDKHNKGPKDEAEIGIEYVQHDGAFNDSVFPEKARNNINNMPKTEVPGFIEKPFDVTI